MERRFVDSIHDLAPEQINFSDKFNAEGFCNPRHFYQGGEIGAMNGQGFDDESMSQLAADIKERGITTPLICRWISPEGKPCDAITPGAVRQLIDGERRLRVAFMLGLASVPCFVHDNMSDDDAWMVAWRSNDTPKAIGENATAALVKFWRHKGYSDQQIIKITNRTAQWLRQMDTLGHLDEQSFDAYAKGLLSLRVALKLALIDNLEIRRELLAETLADAERDHNELLDRSRKAVNKAQEKVETAEAELGVAGLMGKAPDAKEIKNAENALKAAENALAEQEAAPAQAKAKNLARASKRVGARQVASALTKAKMQKCLGRIDEWIENEGREGDEFIGHLEHLHLAKHLLNACLNGDDNMKKVFTEFYEHLENAVIDDTTDDDDPDYEEEEEEEEEDYGEDERVYDELRKYGVEDE